MFVLFAVIVVAEGVLPILKVEMLFRLGLEVLQLILELKLLSGRMCLVELIVVRLHDSIISFNSAQNGDFIEIGAVLGVSG